MSFLSSIVDFPTRSFTYDFPFDSTVLKDRATTGGYVEAKIEQLTRWRAWHSVDKPWTRFRGPFVEPFREREDAKWQWAKLVRKHRKNRNVRCAGVTTSDGSFQGAIIYRLDGRSLLERQSPAVYIEYLATAPWNREDYARKPKFRGVGESLLILAMLESYNIGFDGRLVLEPLAGSYGFYKKKKFVETPSYESRMIHLELTPQEAIDQLQVKGLIR